jgi:hypothetical protein
MHASTTAATGSGTLLGQTNEHSPFESHIFLPFPPPLLSAKVPGVSVGMRLLGIPYYMLLLLQPQAVVLCWGSLQVGQGAPRGFTHVYTQGSYAQ